jgi:glucose-6-phosphate isomerase
MQGEQVWKRFQKYFLDYDSIGMSLDVSRMNFSDDFLQSMEPRMQKAFEAMAALEKGAIANPDENRMVGHYWLRNPALAPTPEIRSQIEQTLQAIKAFAASVHSGTILGESGAFRHILVIGIGGSALGPQFVANALGHPKRDKMKVWFFDNTDPDGMHTVLSNLEGQLGHTICIVISKSGGTKETRNGMLEAEAAYAKAGLKFARHAVAVTGAGSELDKLAERNRWLDRFPMWDWVGGRTSETSAVGLLPAALQGTDIDEFLAGARACDELTRRSDSRQNPAALLALMWFYAGNGKGSKDMVVLPYKDRLELFSRYLQQLVMESIGKEKDLNGRIVNQGLAVYGNKGSTDQHAYVQQLRDGLNNFFVVFIEVLNDSEVEMNRFVDPGTTSGDYLSGFLLGTRRALHENGRESITITLQEVSPRAIGGLIALFERAVGFYASLINVNAYHQPGVEAGKKAATAVIALQQRILQLITKNPGKSFSIEEIAKELDACTETVFKVCQHLAANRREFKKVSGKRAFDAKFRAG